MSDDPNDILDGDLADDPEGEQLAETGRALGAARPVPAPSFRGELGRLMGALRLARPVAHWRAKALGLVLAGAVLLGLAGAGVAGSGPLRPDRLTGAPLSSAPQDR